MLSPRQCVERALRRQRCDRVPFTVYESKLQTCTAERLLRNRGLCIVNRRVMPYRTHRPNVRLSSSTTYDNGKQLVKTVYETPVGSVSTLTEPADFTSWHHEKMFKGPDDYKVLLFMIQDEQYEPAYERFARAQADSGDDAIHRAAFGLEPLQALISGGMIDMQDFCEQWMDHRDELLKLYDALVEKRRKLYPIVAQSPALIANYGGNVTPEIIGLETFEKYYVPHYNEAAEVVHRHGKLIGCHFDANCKLLSKAIAGTALDYIEAFTPAPGSDMTLAEARQAWSDKVLWLNFPSATHLESDAVVERQTVELLESLPHVDGLIIGVTEDVPEHRWRDSYRAIMDGLDRHAEEHPEQYAPAHATVAATH